MIDGHDSNYIIDEFRYYDTNLSASDIMKIYQYSKILICF